MELEKKYDEYIDILKDILEILGKSQNAVRCAYCPYIIEKHKIRY